MTIFEKKLEENSLAALKLIKGEQIKSFYSDAISFHSNRLETQRLSISINEYEWINISCMAYETPNDNDYYELLIEKGDRPTGINYDILSRSLIYPVSSIHLKPAKILSVDIYNRDEKYGGEILIYDVLLIFNCDNNLKFMISMEERVDEFLIYTTDEGTINKYLEGLTLRISVQ